MADVLVVVVLLALIGASAYALMREPPKQLPQTLGYTTETQIHRWPEGTHDATRDNYQWPVPMHAAVGWERS